MLTVDLPKDLMQGRRLIEAGALVDAAKLADPERCQLRTAATLMEPGVDFVGGTLVVAPATAKCPPRRARRARQYELVLRS